MSNVNVNIINPFIQSTLETLKTQCSTEATPTKPFLKGQGADVVPVIVAVMGMVSKEFNGTIALCFPEKTYLKIMNGMLGENATSITKDLEDGAGELLNIIFGQGKKILADSGHKLERAIPTIIKGEEITVKHMAKSGTIVLPFSVPDTPGFQMEISADQN